MATLTPARRRKFFTGLRPHTCITTHMALDDILWEEFEHLPVLSIRWGPSGRAACLDVSVRLMDGVEASADALFEAFQRVADRAATELPGTPPLCWLGVHE